MRCMACGAEMILMNVVEDVSMPVPGFERHAYACSLCHDTEERLIFNKRDKECGHVAASPQASTTQNLRATARSFLAPLRAKVPILFRRGV